MFGFFPHVCMLLLGNSLLMGRIYALLLLLSQVLSKTCILCSYRCLFLFYLCLLVCSFDVPVHFRVLFCTSFSGIADFPSLIICILPYFSGCVLNIRYFSRITFFTWFSVSCRCQEFQCWYFFRLYDIEFAVSFQYGYKIFRWFFGKSVFSCFESSLETLLKKVNSTVNRIFGTLAIDHDFSALMMLESILYSFFVILPRASGPINQLKSFLSLCSSFHPTSEVATLSVIVGLYQFDFF